MKLASVSLALLLAIPFVSAQKNLDLTGKTLNLPIISSSGNNGNAVVYNKDKDLYYAAYAGNAAYPVETFNSQGANLYQGKTGADIRGLWYNPKTQNLEANGYNDFGFITIKTDSRGYAGTGTETIYKGMNQPSAQACGNIDRKGEQILYYTNGSVVGYDRETGKQTDLKVYLETPTSLDNINTTAFIYTGKKKMEIGLLNYAHKEVYFFNLKNGEHTATVKLPGDAVTHNIFRFAFANGYIFLYDKESRSWTGYQLFD
ncbi:MAG: hypothetical protein N4A46_03600 [Schleiferiaceae bacterium]|nr:hypothetical protein [Schleiferiaceae bacterium]